jgi:hypothetical protein
LRTWHATSSTLADGHRTLLQDICGLLEFYICGCIPYGPKDLGGWWSDGVVHLEISEPKPGRFNLLGVTWIDSLGMAPYEVDLELDPNDDIYFAKTIFRIGIRDNAGRPMVCDRNFQPTRVLENRPRYNRDWAMAVELTRPRLAAEHSDPPKSPISRAPDA